MTTDITFAPALPSLYASQSKCSATRTAAYGARLREVTRRGLPGVRSGTTGAGCVPNTVVMLGSDTAPATSSPRSHNAICTAQSARPSPYSLVPSSGSTIHTRSAAKRRRSSEPSSDNTESLVRNAVNASIKKLWASMSPVSLRFHIVVPRSTNSSRWITSISPVTRANSIESSWSSRPFQESKSSALVIVGRVPNQWCRVQVDEYLFHRRLLRPKCECVVPLVRP